MTDNKDRKTISSANQEPAGAPPRRTFTQRAQGVLGLDNEALHLDTKAYRWAILKGDKFGRDDYGYCYDMGYRDTLMSSLKLRVKSESEDKVIRETKDGTMILVEAPIEYRQMTNDEAARDNEQKIRQQMGITEDKNLQIDGNNITLTN